MYVHSAACCLGYLRSVDAEALSGGKGQVWLFPGSCSVGIEPGPAGLGCSGLARCCGQAAAGLSSGSCRVPPSSGLGEIRALRQERHLRGSLLAGQSCCRACLAGSGSSAAAGTCRWLWHLWHSGAGAAGPRSGLAWSCAQPGRLGESKEPKAPDSREASAPVPVCAHGALAGRWLQAAPWRAAPPGAAAPMADPVLTVTSEMAAGAKRREQPRRGTGQKDAAFADPQKSLQEALSLLGSDDW